MEDHPLSVIGGFEEEPYTITNTVKNGRIQRVKEHKTLGTWIDETGDYGINIRKKKEKLKFMITTTKNEASPKNVGVYALEARLMLAEIVVIKSILYNAEAFHEYQEDEMTELERIQHTVLVGILELPASTPYYALLMETGWWTIKGRLAYTKLMLYHNILTSDDRRVIKKIVEVQKELNRSTTWYSSIIRYINNYGIELDAENTLKSQWKKHVKQKIGEKTEREIRDKCDTMSKARTVKSDIYEMKEYLRTASFYDSKKILKTRLHMSKLPGNYKGKGEGMCTLCNVEKGNFEHYFNCRYTRQLVQEWGLTECDLGSLEKDRLKAVANFVDKVEIMLEPTKIFGSR